MSAALVDRPLEISQPAPLKPGPEWSSFEQFRIAGPNGMEAVNTGEVGTLRTKSSVFRLLRDEDFQALIGLASEAARLKGGLETMIHAAMVVKDHPESPSAVGLLLHLAAQFGMGSARPSTVREELSPAPEDDDVITDPAELKRRVAKR